MLLDNRIKPHNNVLVNMWIKLMFPGYVIILHFVCNITQGHDKIERTADKTCCAVGDGGMGE